MATSVLAASEIPLGEPIWRLSVEQYHSMIDAGILASDSPVELIEGVLLQKLPKKPAHSFTTAAIQGALIKLLPSGNCVRTQEPITLADSEPEPDVAIARGGIDDYSDRHPGPGDILVVIEVSDTTLDRDRGLKQRVYARAGIPIYWIADVAGHRVEVRSDPRGHAFRTVTVYAEGEEGPCRLSRSRWRTALQPGGLPP